MSESVPPWTDDDAPTGDGKHPTGPPLSARERLNGVLGRMYRIQREIDAYDVLHDAELTRLKARRDKSVGPLERRTRRLRRFAEIFAVRAWLDFGDTKHQVPNGDITSRPVQYKIDKVDDEVYAASWSPLIGGAVELRPWVDMKKLRGWLDAQTATGFLQRMVSKPSEDPGEAEWHLVDEADGWPFEFAAGFEGVWFWTEAGAAEYDTEHGDILEGVRWTPNGTDGSGRNFQIRL